MVRGLLWSGLGGDFHISVWGHFFNSTRCRGLGDFGNLVGLVGLGETPKGKAHKSYLPCRSQGKYKILAELINYSNIVMVRDVITYRTINYAMSL